MEIPDKTDMGYMCSHANLCDMETLDISSLDTSEVIRMSYMFGFCEKLTSIDLSRLDTSKAESMRGMFIDCHALTALDLSAFDTSNVEDMSEMFLRCNGLTSLDLSNFDTSKVESMFGMFADCSELVTLNISSFDASNADVGKMFYGCRSLKTVIMKNCSDETVEKIKAELPEGVEIIPLNYKTMTNKEMKTRLADMAGQISTIEEERREFVWTECVPAIISRMKEKGKSTLYLREAEYNKFFEPGELWGYFKGAFYAAKELRLDNDKLMLEYSMVSYSQSTYNMEPYYYNRFPHYYSDGNEDGMVAEVDREISDAILVGIIDKLIDDEIYKIGFHGRVEDDLMLNYTIDSDEFNIEGFTYFPAKDIRFVWNMERLDKTVTHLPFDIYVNTCRETDHPLALFIPDEYHDPLRYFAVVIYDGGSVGFPDDKLLRFMHHIEPRDLSNVLRFTSHYKDLLIQLSKGEGETTVMELNSDAFLLNKTPIDKSYLLKEDDEDDD